MITVAAMLGERQRWSSVGPMLLLRPIAQPGGWPSIIDLFGEAAAKLAAA